MKIKSLSLWLLFFVVCAVVCCKKMDRSSTDPSKASTTANALSARETELLGASNSRLLRMVLRGTGGNVDANDPNSPYMPSYTPPSVSDGMLSFLSQQDLENYQDALDLIQSYWTYSNVNYEDTPDEINHLGDEPLNIIDSTLGLHSLRAKYELNDFYDGNWEDTAKMNVNDDALENVLNDAYEVKIGTDYFKYINNSMIINVINEDLATFQQVRTDSLATLNLPNVKIFNKFGEPMAKPQTPLGCATAVSIYAVPDTRNPANNTWRVHLTGTFFFDGSMRTQGGATVKYIINWGDGTSDFTITGEEFSANHTYTGNFAMGVTNNYQVSVSAQVVTPSNAMRNCPNITTPVVTDAQTLTLEVPNCTNVGGDRLYYSTDYSVGGKIYRMKVKLKQRSQIGSAVVTGIGSKYEAVLVFQKKKSSGGYKKTKPLNTMGILEKGNVYKYDVTTKVGCDELIKTLSEASQTSGAKKVKIKWKDPHNTSTHAQGTDLFNADYWFTFGGQTYTINKNLYQ